jgi:hypothetical protein
MTQRFAARFRQVGNCSARLNDIAPKWSRMLRAWTLLTPADNGQDG